MRIPVILMLLTILLLPADLRGLVAQVESSFDVARASVAKVLVRSDAVQVAEAPPALVLGAPVVQVR
jgi:hypothetical protein